MYYRKQKLSQAPITSENQTEVTNAVMLYVQSEQMTITKLASMFNVSENTISSLLCNAIANNYISNTTVCKQLICKHLLEYESKHMLKNSSLRQMYRVALQTYATDIAIEI